MNYNNVSTIAVILVPPANRSKNLTSILKRLRIYFYTVVFENLYFTSVLTQTSLYAERSSNPGTYLWQKKFFLFFNPTYPPPIIPYGVGEGILGIVMLIFRRLKRKQNVCGGTQKNLWDKQVILNMQFVRYSGNVPCHPSVTWNVCLIIMVRYHTCEWAIRILHYKAIWELRIDKSPRHVTVVATIIIHLDYNTQGFILWRWVIHLESLRHTKISSRKFSSLSSHQ